MNKAQASQLAGKMNVEQGADNLSPLPGRKDYQDKIKLLK